MSAEIAKKLVTAAEGRTGVMFSPLFVCLSVFRSVAILGGGLNYLAKAMAACRAALYAFGAELRSNFEKYCPVKGKK